MAAKSKRKGTSKQILNSSSQRVTNQRALLLDLIRKNDGHLDADELFRKANEKNHRLSLSTVYRNLQLFKKLGLIAEYHFVEEHHHYEAKPSTEHQHLVCLSCGKIVEFNLPLSQQLKDTIGKQHKFEIKEIELHLSGLCSTCRKKKVRMKNDYKKTA
jgi:Fur family ferric uptake transcriptional regulator